MVEEKKKRSLLIATHAGEDPERAIFPLLLANAAQAMDVEAVVALAGHGVYLAKKGYADNIASRPYPFKDAGGKLRSQWWQIPGLNPLNRGAEDQSG